MKARIIAMFLAAMMVLSLGGCGGNKSTPAPEVKPTQEGEVSRFTADELEEFWSSGSLTKEEIGTMFSAGEISSEVYEEFLNRMSEDVEFNAPEDEDSESAESPEEPESPATNIDTSSLLTAHVIEFEDADGYQIRETIQISPIFRGDDLETAYALWEALGNDVTDFPSEEVLHNENHELESYQLEYVVGTYAIENTTEGFSITPNNPRRYVGALTAEGNDNTATLFNNRSVSAVAYSNSTKYYSDIFAVVIGEPKMTSDVWGPRTFVIALPNAYTPNQPSGYHYDEIQVIFSYNSYGSYDHSNYDSFKLEYFE